MDRFSAVPSSEINLGEVSMKLMSLEKMIEFGSGTHASNEDTHIG
jgi:hypothetical protein